MSRVGGTIQDHRNTTLNASTTVAAMSIERVGGRLAGAAVQPAVWLADYAVNGSKPDGVDVGLFAFGLTGPIGAAAAAGTGLIKGITQDHINRQLAEAKSYEPNLYRKGLRACYNYGWSAPLINAQTIASRGGTAWQHPNGLWVYIIDELGRFVADYFAPRRIGHLPAESAARARRQGPLPVACDSPLIGFANGEFAGRSSLRQAS